MADLDRLHISEGLRQIAELVFHKVPEPLEIEILGSGQALRFMSNNRIFNKMTLYLFRRLER
jgi:hypothetical protein